MKIEIKTTKDNSHTLYVPSLDETYHSVHGAIQEANHVFINAGLNILTNKNIKVFEVGFGTGLNACLANQYAIKNNVNIDYDSIELHPLSMDIINMLNYAEVIEGLQKSDFDKLHHAEWNEKCKLSDFFTLQKIKKSIFDYNEYEKFDVIFFDAFGPNTQPEMWTKSVFEKIYRITKEEGILVTYCAKGVVKRTLKDVGFLVETLPGPPGKREMTRAIKKQSN